MTSTALHPHLHFTAPAHRTLLLLLGALVLVLAATATWVAVDRNDGSRVPAITGDGVPLWPPLSPPGGRPLLRLESPERQTPVVTDELPG